MPGPTISRNGLAQRVDERCNMYRSLRPSLCLAGLLTLASWLAASAALAEDSGPRVAGAEPSSLDAAAATLDTLSEQAHHDRVKDAWWGMVGGAGITTAGVLTTL